jgi:hypothetical protein
MTAAMIHSPLALQTFDIRPTPPRLAAAQTIDELMVDWGDLPAGCSASIYLPAVSADEVLALASSMYVSRRFSRVDDHTLSCVAGGITYLPIPKSFGQNYAGLLSVALPAARPGAVYSLTVRQVTAMLTTGDIANAAAPAPIQWRRVLGTFQVSLSVKRRDQVLFALERLYAVLLWIAEAIVPADRWYPVFQRYLGQLGGQISGLGGNPGRIQPSPSGEVPGLPLPKPAPKPQPSPPDEVEQIFGKIEAIIYDHFGDFEGFILETVTGKHHRFMSREAPMLEVVHRAWIERTRVAVVPETWIRASIGHSVGGPRFV